MGTFSHFMVMVAGSTLLLVLSATLTAASVCPPGKQYLNQELDRCVNCTVCDHEKGQLVLRPCQVHKDTVCGPLSQLSINWDFLQQRPEHHHRHQHCKHNRHNHESNNGNNGHDVVWHFDEENKGKPVHAARRAEVTSTEAPFSNAEALVWDWQAICLTLAVFACILFFLVAAVYSIHQAKQWRRLKENFEADVEELSARLSLMVASGEFGENLEPNTGPIHDGNYLNNHCVYLEQLLVRKDTKIGTEAGNVYIEESNGKT